MCSFAVDTVYCVVLLIASVLNCLMALASFWRIAVDVWPRRQADAALPSAVPVSIIIPCYLPSDHAVVEATVAHILDRLEHTGPLTVLLVYNTPSPHPAEARLAELSGRAWPAGRGVRLVKAEGSRSKAENLNAALALVQDEYVALYDTLRLS